jgi:hypothetical protein
VGEYGLGDKQNENEWIGVDAASHGDGENFMESSFFSEILSEESA